MKCLVINLIFTILRKKKSHRDNSGTRLIIESLKEHSDFHHLCWLKPLVITFIFTSILYGYAKIISQAILSLVSGFIWVLNSLNDPCCRSLNEENMMLLSSEESSNFPAVIHESLEIHPQTELQNIISRLEEETRCIFSIWQSKLQV